MRIPRWRLWLSTLLVLTALSAWAQDDDDLFGENLNSHVSANLSLNFDRHGGVAVRLNLPHDASSSDALPGLLGQALHCPPGALKRPDQTDDPFPHFAKNWSTAKKERYRKQLEAINAHLVKDDCPAALAENGSLLQGDFDYSAVAAELQRMGVDQLTIYVNLPQTQFRDYSQSNLVHGPWRSETSLLYLIPLTASSKPAIFHLTYGFRRADLYRAVCVLAAFIVLPVLVTLWLRHGALASAKVDAAGAWFRFFRTLNWLVNGAMLLWITSGFGARRALQDWIAGLHLSTWKVATADVAVTIVPAFLVYFLCVALSYPLHAQLRGSRWTRPEFLARQLVTVGAQAVPLMLLLSGLGILHKQPDVSIVLIVVSLAALQILQVVKMRLVKELPQPLTTGDLRDRVFALAAKMGVKVQQIFVLPAGKGQVANAYAAKNRIVMFTDYLLEHLSKREVDAIAAHELAHLRFKHPGKRGAVLIAAILLPYYFTWLVGVLLGLLTIPFGLLGDVAGARLTMWLWRGVGVFERWSQRDFALLMLGMTVFYFVSRHFENVADAAAVRLTGDPEAQITGLLKVNRLNLTPIQWGKASESWLTHPSTVRRAHRIAAAGGLPPERLEQILQHYAAQESSATVVPAEDCYAVPPPGDAEKLRLAVRDRARAQVKIWAHYAVYVLPLALVSMVVRKAQLEGSVALLAYLAGLVATAGILTLTGVWLGEAGRNADKKRLKRLFERDRVAVGREDDTFVGYAPGPFPRIFGTRYHWDAGFLVLAKDRMQFVGEQVRFSLPASEVDRVVLSRGGPSWWKFERIYVRWKRPDGSNGIFNLNCLEPGSVWQTRARVRALCRRLSDWHQGVKAYPEVRPELADTPPLEVRQVTSLSPAKLGGWGTNLRILLTLLPLAIGVGVLTHADIPYLCGSVIALRLYQSVPYWRYRDVVPVFPQRTDGSSRARGVSAAGVTR